MRSLITFLVILSLVILEASAARAQGERSAAERGVPADLTAALNRLATTLDEEARLARDASEAIAAARTPTQPGEEDVPFRFTARWGLTSQQVRGDLELPNESPAIEGLLSRQKALTSVRGKADAFSNYADYVRGLGNQLEGLTDEEVADRLESSFVPPDVEMLLLQPADEDLRNRFEAPLVSGILDGSQGLEPFVVGAGSATVDFPSVGALLYDRAGEGYAPFCTGTLIASHVVLTAAHCFCDLRSEKGGSFNKLATSCREAKYFRNTQQVGALDSRGHAFFLQHVGLIPLKGTVVIPDEYDWPKADLALVFLDRQITSVQPAALNNVAATSQALAGLVVGFGVHSRLNADGEAISFDIGGAAGIKLFGYADIGICGAKKPEDQFICMKYVDTVAERIFASTCKGDSGGPLFVKMDGNWRLAGVTSGGAGNCAPNTTAFNVEVFKFLPWVRKELDFAKGPEAVENVARALRPLTNEGRFAAQTRYKSFAQPKEAWTRAFDLVGDPELMRIAVNATREAATSLSLEVVSPEQSQKCKLGGDDASYVCEVRQPVSGKWWVTVTGSSPREFQMVATVF